MRINVYYYAQEDANMAFYTTEEAAKILRYEPETLTGLARKGKAPVMPVKVGRRWLWPKGEIDKLAGGL